MNLDELLQEANKSQLLAHIQKVAAAYSTRLAVDLLEAYKQPFRRVVEDVQIDHGECRRRLTIDWHLPTLAEALPKTEFVEDARYIAKFEELCPNLVVPLLPVDKGHLMNGFVAEGPASERLYLCGQDESVERTRLMLTTLWQWIDHAASGSKNCRYDLLDRARNSFYSLPDQSPTEGRDTIRDVLADLAASQVELRPGLKERVSLMGRYTARQHIIWLQLPSHAGHGVRLTVTYRTRFAAGYSPRRGGPNGLGTYRFYRRTVDWFRRVTGQEPYRFAIPVELSALCRSYHFHMPAPPAMYFASQRFALERNLHQSRAEQEKAFKQHYRVNGAYVSGKDEAGGPVAHLYARDLPATADNQLYAYARVRERPPGTTALVLWLSVLTACFLWFYYFIWKWLVANDTQGIDLASLSVTLLGVAAIWFSHAFRDDIRPRVPLVSRLGLVLVGVSTIYSLLAILVHRVTCAPANPLAPNQVCAPVFTSLFSQHGLLVVAALVTVVAVWLAERRVSLYREYQKLQAAIERYLR